MVRGRATPALSKSFRDLDTITLAHMAYCAIDAPDSVLGERIVRLYSEIDCRIEHGADSNGHLEYVRNKLRGL